LRKGRILKITGNTANSIWLSQLIGRIRNKYNTGLSDADNADNGMTRSRHQ